MIPVGPFQLLNPIGKGGMGEVWAAVHVEHSTKVAVKVLNAKRLDNPKFIKAFFKEARAMAGLVHPNIVTIYDYGVMGEAAQTGSMGRLMRGTPYMAMEFVGGGTLSSHKGTMAWPDMKVVLLSLLDALAHAHARGVIHKDLKPGNVLLGDDQQGVKLTDFGIAHALESEEASSETPLQHIGGTPAYMAPEQFDGDNREMGPWTDLYSLGCMAWTLATGSAPYGKKNWVEVANGHLHLPLPPFEPQVQVPKGFDEWLRAILEKEPNHRFRKSADAAWALLSLRDPPKTPLRSANPDDDATASTVAFGDRTTLIWGETDEVRARAPRPHSPALPKAFTMPPMPVSWRRGQKPVPNARLVETGLGVFPLRALPIVGRQDERDRLWLALRDVRKADAARAVVITGPAGVGKSRLAQWLTQRADELGAASVLRASHSPISTRRDGLHAMLARYLRCFGYPRELIASRLARDLRAEGVEDPYLVQALAEFITPATFKDTDQEARNRAFTPARQRHQLVLGVVERACAERPVILWLEDVQWGLDALDFVEVLFNQRPHLRVLVVVTARDSTLVDRPEEQEAVDRLTSRPETSVIRVGPLPDEAHARLVQRLLPLAPDLAREVETRTEGNPMFAVQLVGDWVARGLLVRGEDGFTLRPGSDVTLPESLQKAWADTLDRFLKGRPHQDGVALELAAVLGTEVEAEEWRVACRMARITPSADLVEQMFGERLAWSFAGSDVGWSFAHAMLTEALELRAQAAGRLEGHHALAAQILDRGDSGVHLERRAWHLLAAGLTAEALGPLLTAAQRHLRTGDHRAASVLLNARERALDAAQYGDRDPDRVRGWLARAALHRNQRDLDEGFHLALRAEKVARARKDVALLHGALREQGLLHRVRGEMDEARNCLKNAIHAAEVARDLLGQADATTDLGWVIVHKGELDRARDTFLKAAVLYREAGADPLAASCWLGLCDVARKEGNYPVALTWLSRARSAWEIQGSKWGLATAANNLADLQRLSGDPVAAEAGYREAVTRLEQLGEAEANVPRLNLVILLLAKRRYDEAMDELGPILGSLAASQNTLRAMVHVAFLPPLAAREDLFAFDAHLEQALALLRQISLNEVDVAELLEQAAELWVGHGDRVRAEAAWAEASRQWSALGREDRWKAVEERRRG